MPREREPEGKWRLLNPLCVRFSQPRIAKHFRDGHLLHEASTQFSEARLEDLPEARRAALKDSAPGAPPYDSILLPPFPAIRVISWRPKLRRDDGEAVRDEYGDTILGKRAWFALDNRRLYSLQQAAAKLWPKRCCVVVSCIEEVPGQTIRELRKFRTTTEGKSVLIGARTGAMEDWQWTMEAPAGSPLPESGEVEPDGFYPEELWDAQAWAPFAMEVARRPPAEERADEPSGSPDPEPRRMPDAAAVAAAAAKLPNPMLGMSGYGMGFGLGLGAYGLGAMAAPSYLALCPAKGWEYVDPSGKVQGPFPLEKMVLWHQHNFFYPTLMMRCDPADRFVQFKELWPPGMPPFTLQVIRHRQ